MLENWLSRVPFSTEQPLWRYALLAWPLALVPSLLLIALALGVLSLFGVDIDSLRNGYAPNGTLNDAVRTVLLAPLLETLVLAALMAWFSMLSPRLLISAGISALLWGLLHGLASPLWFFGTVWAFFVYSYGYQAWRAVSRWHALAAAALPHALSNLAMVVLVLLLRST
jgi:hypothetical protein